MTTSLDPSTLFAAPPPPSSLASRANGAGTASPATKNAALKQPASAPRVDLEPLYTALKGSIAEYWAEYKDAVALFVLGKLNLSEFGLRTDHFLTADPQIEHLHNKLIVGLLANVGREAPEAGVAPWVSANDKPTAGLSKSTAGNEAERRLKTEVMQLPAKERRRIKDIPDLEHRNPSARVLAYHNAKQLHAPSAADTAAATAPPSAGGALNRGNINTEVEIRKLYSQSLAAETGEFPDRDAIQARLGPLCIREDLAQGASSTCAGYLATSTEYYIKHVLTQIYLKTRLNMNGGSATGAMTHRFKQQLGYEEEAASRGLMDRVGGLLPCEAREAAVRRPLEMGDLKMVMQTGDSLMGNFPYLQARVLGCKPAGDYEEHAEQRRNVFQELREKQEAEARRLKLVEVAGTDTRMNGVEQANGQLDASDAAGKRSVIHFGDDDNLGWQGGSRKDRNDLNALLAGLGSDV